jgi:hypothetical protein
MTRVLRAGVAEGNITPPLGIEMGGFGRRVQPAVEVRDPLFAKALILENDGERVGIVSCDLLGFSLEYDRELRHAIATTGVVKADRVMIACTHNHAGPATQFLRNCGMVDEKWLAFLKRQILEIVAQAAATLQPVTMEYSFGRVARNYNRRAFLREVGDPQRERESHERDTRVSVAQFKSGEKPVANLLHYACHPVTMLRHNRGLSAEYCGMAARTLQEKTGAITLFLNGACGDINPLVRDDSGQLKPVTDFCNGYEHTIELGKAIGEAAHRALKRARPIASTKLSATMQYAEVPSNIKPVQEIEKTLRFHQAALKARRLDETELWVHTTFLDWAQAARAAVLKGSETQSTPVPMQQVSIGELTLFGVGGELFSAIGKRIQKTIGAPCLVVGYANGNIGYLPTRRAFSIGDYEVEDAGGLYGLFGAGSETERVLLDAVRRMDFS